MKHDLQRIAASAAKASHLAGDEIMKIYRQTDVGIITKGDGSPVTAADHASEAVLLPKLREITPDIPIVSEESYARGERVDISGGTFWVVDPLDGTREFINRGGGFVVALALITDRKVALSVVHHPLTGITYAAHGPGTTTRTLPGEKPEQIKTRPLPSEGALLLINGPWADEPRIADWRARTKIPVARREDSSQIFYYARVAEGSADVFLAVYRQHEDGIYWWDTAPGQALVEGAGGTVLDLKGQKIIYNTTDYKAPAHIVCGFDSKQHF